MPQGDISYIRLGTNEFEPIIYRKFWHRVGFSSGKSWNLRRFKAEFEDYTEIFLLSNLVNFTEAANPGGLRNL